MLRFVAITALSAALFSPAVAEPGFVKTVSLPALGSGQGPAPKAVCELPAYVSVRTSQPVSADSQAMTLSPRMVQAIRIGEAPVSE